MEIKLLNVNNVNEQNKRLSKIINCNQNLPHIQYTSH